MSWTRYHRGVSLLTLVRVTAFSRTGHLRRPLVRCWLAPQEQQFPVGVRGSTRWVEAVPIKSMAAADCADAFIAAGSRSLVCRRL
jgi:hypothetical protein